MDAISGSRPNASAVGMVQSHRRCPPSARGEGPRRPPASPVRLHSAAPIRACVMVSKPFSSLRTVAQPRQQVKQGAEKSGQQGDDDPETQALTALPDVAVDPDCQQQVDDDADDGQPTAVLLHRAAARRHVPVRLPFPFHLESAVLKVHRPHLIFEVHVGFAFAHVQQAVLDVEFLHVGQVVPVLRLDSDRQADRQ